jgi:hypothetical protein
MTWKLDHHHHSTTRPPPPPQPPQLNHQPQLMLRHDMTTKKKQPSHPLHLALDGRHSPCRCRWTPGRAHRGERRPPLIRLTTTPAPHYTTTGRNHTTTTTIQLFPPKPSSVGSKVIQICSKRPGKFLGHKRPRNGVRCAVVRSQMYFRTWNQRLFLEEIC